MSITTREGDGGRTRLRSGERVSKADPRLDTLGDLDELVCALGLVRARSLPPPLAAGIRRLQRDLFDLGGALVPPPGPCATTPDPWPAERLAGLEAQCAALESEGPAPRGFLLPGRTPAGAQLHMARALARRLERSAARWPSPPSPAIRAWLNRLSDLLWLLARAADRRGGVPKAPPG